MLGENGTGKTTFIKMLAECGKKKDKEKDKEKEPDEEEYNLPVMSISYKPQTITPTFKGSVRDLLNTKVKEAWLSPTFAS
jgi:ATP-binding cassette subfamily E protein 1